MTVAELHDERAGKLAKDYLHTEGQLLELLTVMRKKKVFAELNYLGVFDYCHRKLRFSRAQSYYFKSVAEKSEEVPEIKTAVVTGELTLSQARRIVSVVTKENNKEWIEKAKALPQLELEKEVALVNPNAFVREKMKDSELRVPVNDETEKNIACLTDILSQKLHRPATLSDVVAWMAREMKEKHVSSGNSVKAVVKRRDENRCTFKSKDGRRCTQKRWLHIHHIKERSRGGTNTVENLTILCASHHRYIHSG